MPNWPRDYENAENVYNNNEEYGTGRYPISENKHWHSGIHINFLSGSVSNKVYSFIKGELVAYRISESYRTVDRPSVINESEWNRLSGWERGLYRKNGGIYEIMPNISREAIKEKYSNSFILLKHFFNVKEQGKSEDICFFTLYTNIIPLMENKTQEYKQLQTAPKEIPFYYKYRFQVNKNIDISCKYTVKEDKKLFPGSHCTFWEKDNTTYSCNFDNFNSPEKKIEVKKTEIKIFYYTPIRADVPLYKTDMSVAMQNYPDRYELNKLATLKSNAKFTGDIRSAGKFYSVLVKKDDVSENGVIKTDNTRVLVRKEDMKGRGCLIDNLFCSLSIKGIMIYDNDNIGGNARDILEGGKEIELAKPERFLNSPDKNGKYFVLKRESADKPLQYMLYKEPYNKSYDPLLVRIQQNTGLYTFNEAAVPKEKTAINEDTLLGYAHLPPSYNNAHYDVSLFFGDNSFLNKQCEAYVERYYIPLSITLYKLLKEDNINPAFTIEEQFNTPHIFRAANESVRIGLRENYTKFFYNNEYYYLSEYTARQYKINMLEWKKFFRVIEKKADTIDDIIDGLGFIKKNYQWGTDSRNVGAALGDSNPDWHQEKNEIPKTRSIKRSIICGHPLELDKELYIENGKVKQKIKRSYGTGDFQNELDYFKNKVEAVDIWGGLKGKKIDGLDTNKNSFWFAHPVYFIKNVYEAGLLDTTFNPYYEEEIHIPIGGMHLESRAQKVIDSPGFAPVTSVATGYKGGKTHYSICTSLFNVSRQLKNRIMRHEGVDLAPYKNEKTEIKSLIYGKVWACTYSGTIQEKADSGYGRVMIIKALHEKKLYVLAHLDRYLKEVDDIVYPGDTVAKCGQTGNSTGVHLHVEVRLCEETEKKDVLSEEGNQKHKNDDSKSNGNGLAWAKEGNISKEPPRVNPFNHDENYKVT